jgi:hypothetical protein
MLGAPEPQHFQTVAQAILAGDVVPVLGAGANMCDRVGNEPWEPGRTLPSGEELADLLARRFSITTHGPSDLLRVSQAAALGRGDVAFYRQLHSVFARDEKTQNDYEPTSLHRFLAELPALRVRRGLDPCPQLIVTTNYDDLVEQAFTDAGEPFDVVYYLAQGEVGPGGRRKHQGKFVHVDPSGARRIVTTPKKYVDANLAERTVILKIHGAARPEATEDSWVITEDHYIDYLTRTNLSDLIPVKLLEKLLSSNFLFLGYAMKDWNLRVMLHRIWIQRDSSWPAWAVQIDPDELDVKMWAEKNIDIECMPLKTYFEDLRSCLETVEVGF